MNTLERSLDSYHKEETTVLSTGTVPSIALPVSTATSFDVGLKSKTQSPVKASQKACKPISAWASTEEKKTEEKTEKEREKERLQLRKDFKRSKRTCETGRFSSDSLSSNGIFKDLRPEKRMLRR
eukprot:394982-Amorphochlora_amoeboformis.AAC.1